jgi:hypothetical protein
MQLGLESLEGAENNRANATAFSSFSVTPSNTKASGAGAYSACK